MAETIPARIAKAFSPCVEHPDHKALLEKPDTRLSMIGLNPTVINALSMEVEDEFGIVLLDEKDEWRTMGDVQACVRSALSKKRRKAT